MDEEYYDMNAILFDENNLLHNYFIMLRMCGLVSCSERYMEARLMHIARAINLMSKNIVEVFKKLRASTEQPIVDNCGNIKIEEFLNVFCKGIQILQQDEINHQCSKNITEDINHEAPFKMFFRSLLGVNYQCSDTEVEKGIRRIDLKIDDVNKLPHRLIIEFKGWWNKDKNDVVEQCLGYLTDFENSAVIFIINHLQSTVVKKYKEKIVTQNESYVQNSWGEVNDKNTEFRYYKSKHVTNEQIKTLYHFIVSPKIYCRT